MIVGFNRSSAIVIRCFGSSVRILGRKTPVSSKAAVTLTPKALNRVKQILNEKENPAIGLRIGVRTRGCNGLSYTMDYVQKKGALDEEVMQDGVRIFIDSKAQLSLLGSEMDFVEHSLGCEFVFHNPNIDGTCGCGESFNVKKDLEIK